MKSISTTLSLLLLVIAGFLAEQMTARGDQRTSFDDNWLFMKGDPAEVSNQLSYAAVKEWVKASGSEFTKNASPLPSRPENRFNYIPIAATRCFQWTCPRHCARQAGKERNHQTSSGITPFN
jgi:hypothetical protein